MIRVMYQHRKASRWYGQAATSVKLVFVGTMEECRGFVEEFGNYAPDRAYGYGAVWMVRQNGAKVRSRNLNRELDELLDL